MSMATRQLISFKEMMVRVLKEKVTPILHKDNKSAIFLAKSNEFLSLKHVVKLCYHYIKFEAKQGNVEIRWIKSNIS